jgi:hypothetical protein
MALGRMPSASDPNDPRLINSIGNGISLAQIKRGGVGLCSLADQTLKLVQSLRLLAMSLQRDDLPIPTSFEKSL